jgi:hypothetical protein
LSAINFSMTFSDCVAAWLVRRGQPMHWRCLPKPGLYLIGEPELAEFAFTAEMFENLNTLQDLARARWRKLCKDP